MRRHINSLSELGLLTVEVRSSTSGRRSNVYWLNVGFSSESRQPAKLADCGEPVDNAPVGNSETRRRSTHHIGAPRGWSSPVFLGYGQPLASDDGQVWRAGATAMPAARRCDGVRGLADRSHALAALPGLPRRRPLVSARCWSVVAAAGYGSPNAPRSPYEGGHGLVDHKISCMRMGVHGRDVSIWAKGMSGSLPEVAGHVRRCGHWRE